MDQFNLKIKLLLDITTKKRDVLTKILNVTENQNCILSGDKVDKATLEMFRFLDKEKQKGIDEVLSLDTVFQRTFNSIHHLLNNLTQEQKDYIGQLQVLIDEITILDEKIRKSERANNKVAEKKEEQIKNINVPKMDKNKLMEHYKKNSKVNSKIITKS